MNKRKRFVRPVRDVPLSDKEMPVFCERLKKGLLEEYKAKLSFYHRLIGEIHSGIDEKIKSLKEGVKGNEKQQALYFLTAHAIISRSGLIESVTMLDEKIKIALFLYQTKKLRKKTEEVKDDQRVEDALNECLDGFKISNEFKSCRSLMQNFRALRHQFAHNQVGAFSFSADKDNFESFIIGLEGIKLDKSYHALSKGKAAVFIPYNIDSDAFLHKFFKESIKFYSLLLEILFTI